MCVHVSTYVLGVINSRVKRIFDLLSLKRRPLRSSFKLKNKRKLQRAMSRLYDGRCSNS